MHTELTYFPQIVRFMAASHQLPSCESDARKQGILVSALRARAWLMCRYPAAAVLVSDEVRPRAKADHPHRCSPDGSQIL
jgi:hypothetical protein